MKTNLFYHKTITAFILLLMSTSLLNAGNWKTESIINFNNEHSLKSEVFTGGFLYDFDLNNIKHQTQISDKYELIDLFTKEISVTKSEKYALSANDVTILKLNTEALNQIVQNELETIKLSIPYQENDLFIKLEKREVLSPDFKATDHEGNLIDYTPGKYYKGTLENDPFSFVAISFFDDNVIGIISNLQYGNVVIGKSVDKQDYISYSDRNILGSSSFECHTEGIEDNQQMINHINANLNTHFTEQTENCVRLYYEITNSIYINNGNSTTETLDWITGIQNNLDVLYANDGISIQLHSIKIWTTEDPYNLGFENNLNLFKETTIDFDGDLAHLINYPIESGLAAGIDTLCSNNRYAYSGVDMVYAEIPTYSWTIQVIAHEMGHVLGSPHTHECFWNGDNTPIDGCYSNGMNCEMGEIPTEGGTIMSYCHLTYAGINFSLGFGPQPAALIRNTIDSKHCLGTDCINAPFDCHFEISGNVEPITKVDFVDINNSSNPEINGSSALEDFTSITGHVYTNETYTISVEGNTNGNKTSYFAVWIDWDRNGLWDNPNEVYQIGSIHNSTGTDGKKATAQIHVPIEAEKGITKMRVVKSDTDFPNSPCVSFANGQAEDYIIDIGLSGCMYPNYTNSYYTPYCHGEDESLGSLDSTGSLFKGASLTAGVEYTFKSSIATDFITIGNNAATEWYATGIGTVKFTPDTDKEVNISISKNSQCHTNVETRYISISCGEKINLTAPDFNCVKGERSFHKEFIRPTIYDITMNSTYRAAEDFEVESSDDVFKIQQIITEVRSKGTPENATLNIREDNNGEPGQIIKSITMQPSETLLYWDFQNTAVYRLIFDLETSIELTEGKYWLEHTVSATEDEQVLWVPTVLDNEGYRTHYSLDNGDNWIEDTQNNSPLTFYVAGVCGDGLGTLDPKILDFNYYPNPLDDILFMESISPVKELEIFNLNGQKIFDQTNIQNNQISLKALSPGTYLIRVRLTNGIIETFKIIKK